MKDTATNIIMSGSNLTPIDEGTKFLNSSPSSSDDKELAMQSEGMTDSDHYQVQRDNDDEQQND